MKSNKNEGKKSKHFDISNVLTIVHQRLYEFSQDSFFKNKMESIFGVGVDASSFQSDWSQKIFTDFPKIKIRKSAEINGANGAFSNTTGKIYLSEELLTQSEAEIVDVLLEECGHYLDYRINTNDTPGDEGAIFLALVQGKILTKEQLDLLRAKNDHAEIFLDGEWIDIEQNKTNNVVTLTPVMVRSSRGPIIKF